MRIRSGYKRRTAVASFGGAALLMAAASLAWACTSVVGNTWYSDGSWIKTGPTGSSVTIYATGAIANTNYYMISGVNDTPHQHPCIGSWVKENPNIRTSSGTGAIGNTTGTIDRPSSAPGYYHVCFVTTDIDYQHPISTTNPVYFQVT